MRKPQETIRPVVDSETGRLQGFRLSAGRRRARRNAHQPPGVPARAPARSRSVFPSSRGCPSDRRGRAGAPPVFTMYIVGSCGVVGKSFFPDATGALTTAGLAGMPTKAVSALSAHAPNLTFLKNINWPQNVEELRPRGGPRSIADRDRAGRDRQQRVLRRARRRTW